MITIALADDHSIVRAGFRTLLERVKDFRVVGEAADGAQAYNVVAREKPDVLLLDISMPPGETGLTACAKIAKDFPNTTVIVLTMFAEAEYVEYTLKHGARGYLLKSATPQELMEAIKTACNGDIYIHPKMRDVLEESLRKRENDHSLAELSERELSILQLLAKGFTNKEISEQAFLSVKTVEAYRAKIYTKLGFKSRADLVDFALRHKLMNL